MTITNKDTPTGDLTAIKIGDEINNGLGTFGQVEHIEFEDTEIYWKFTFKLIGGGFIEVTKMRNIC